MSCLISICLSCRFVCPSIAFVFHVQFDACHFILKFSSPLLINSSAKFSTVELKMETTSHNVLFSLFSNCSMVFSRDVRLALTDATAGWNIMAVCVFYLVYSVAYRWLENYDHIRTGIHWCSCCGLRVSVEFRPVTLSMSFRKSACLAIYLCSSKFLF